MIDFYNFTVVSFTDPVVPVTDEVEEEVEFNSVQLTLEGLTVDEVSTVYFARSHIRRGKCKRRIAVGKHNCSLHHDHRLYCDVTEFYSVMLSTESYHS